MTEPCEHESGRHEVRTPVGHHGRASDRIRYGEGWNELTRDVLEAVTERTAKKRHQNGKLYGAVLDGPVGPIAVTLHPGGGRVEFFDEFGITAPLVHYFDDDETQPDRWLLSQISRTAGRPPGVPETIARSAGDMLLYRDGRWRWNHWVRGSKGVIVPAEEPGRGDAAVFERPSFGSYDDLLRTDLAQQIWPGLPDLPYQGPWGNSPLDPTPVLAALDPAPPADFHAAAVADALRTRRDGDDAGPLSAASQPGAAPVLVPVDAQGEPVRTPGFGISIELDGALTAAAPPPGTHHLVLTTLHDLLVHELLTNTKVRLARGTDLETEITPNDATDLIRGQRRVTIDADGRQAPPPPPPPPPPPSGR